MLIVESSYQTSPDVPRWYIARTGRHWTSAKGSWDELFGWTSDVTKAACFLNEAHAKLAMELVTNRAGRGCKKEFCRIVEEP